MIERGWQTPELQIELFDRLSRDGRIASTTCGAWKIG